MIWVTKLNDEQIMLNNDLIEKVEQTPDTVVTMTNAKKYVIKEKPDALRRKIIDYKQKIGGWIVQNDAPGEKKTIDKLR